MSADMLYLAAAAADANAKVDGRHSEETIEDAVTFAVQSGYETLAYDDAVVVMGGIMAKEAGF